MKKMVLKSTMEDERSKRRTMNAIAGVGGMNLHSQFPPQYFIVDSIEVDIKEGKITVVGEADPVWLTTKLRKMGFTTELPSVGPAKEEKKSEGPAAAKDEKKGAEKKKQEKKAAEPAVVPTAVYHVNPGGYEHYNEGYLYTVVTEENPSTCIIS